VEWQGAFDSAQEWAPENDPCPEGWRIPTMNDFRALTDNTKVTLELLSVPAVGVKFTDKANGKSIFLTMAGFMSPAGAKLTVGQMGFYAAADNRNNSDPEDIQIGALLFNANEGVWAGTDSIRNAHSVRCVAK
jgi:uncharacterized protein (TIGR02145 family)